MIELIDASITHYGEKGGRKPSENLILSDVGLTVYAGELVYLIGKVGSGKSSLLRTLYGELPLRHGEGWIAGYDLGRLRDKEIPYLRRRLGIVFQDYKLLDDRNLFENLRFVLCATGWRNEMQIRERIDETLEMIGLPHKLYKMPHQLSGGEQQRLAIGRALLNRPEVILADEPTGNLDPESSDEVMRLFAEISASGCAVLIATHCINNIENYPSRTIRFDNGYMEELDIISILGLE